MFVLEPNHEPSIFENRNRSQTFDPEPEPEPAQQNISGTAQP